MSSEGDRDIVSLAAHGDLESVRQVILESEEKGAEALRRTLESVDPQGSGNTALIVAASKGHRELVGLLLEKGSSPVAANRSGQTALHTAAASDEAQCLSLILQKMSSSGQPPSMPGNAIGGNALHTAAAAGSSSCLKLLIELKVPVESTDSLGNTALHKTVFEAHKRCAELLLTQGGANVNAKNAAGETPLAKAVERGHTEFVRFLLSHGADCQISDEKGNTPLHAAARRGLLDVCKVLIIEGRAPVNALNLEHSTPLHLAAEGAQTAEQGSDRKALFNLLIDSGSDVAIKNLRGKAPGHLAPGKFRDLFVVENIEKRHEMEKRQREEEERRRAEEEQRRRVVEAEEARLEEERAKAEEEAARKRAELEERRRLEEEQRKKGEEAKRLAEEEAARAKAAKKKKTKKGGKK